MRSKAVAQVYASTVTVLITTIVWQFSHSSADVEAGVVGAGELLVVGVDATTDATTDATVDATVDVSDLEDSRGFSRRSSSSPSRSPASLYTWKAARAAQKLLRLSASSAATSPSRLIMLTLALVLMPSRWMLLDPSMLIMLSWQLLSGTHSWS